MGVLFVLLQDQVFLSAIKAVIEQQQGQPLRAAMFWEAVTNYMNNIDGVHRSTSLWSHRWYTTLKASHPEVAALVPSKHILEYEKEWTEEEVSAMVLRHCYEYYAILDTHSVDLMMRCRRHICGMLC